LEHITDRDPRGRKICVNQFENMSGDKVRAWRVFHDALDNFPCPGDFCVVTLIGPRTPIHALVKFGANVGRLKIDNMHAGITEFELD
jgi:hypothetical protein